jgi:DNA mismatch repair protein MutL
MGQIQILPDILANQIAAGEVVERPASCVKELLENSLDAGAKSIYVSLEEGGIASMTVQDDGCGMDEEDARLAFARHATSKIKHQRDLFRIATLGFRGEALASIAAVARVTLQTRPHESSHGIQVVVEGGDVVVESTPIGMPPGTKIEVRDLFYNTPARLKYLRSVATEQARCIDIVHQAALARPDVAFRCDVSGHTVFRTSGRGDVLDVLAALYGVGEAKQFLRIAKESADYKVTGWVGRPTQSKSSRSHARLYINQRPIRNIAIHQAVVAGYGHRLMVGKHPMYAIHIQMDPTLVDVNIHPHKAEVRFSEERDLVQLVQQAVHEALDEAFLVPTVSLPGGKPAQRPQPSVQTQLSFSATEQKPSYHIPPAPAREAYAHTHRETAVTSTQGSRVNGRPQGEGRVSGDAWKRVLLPNPEFSDAQADKTDLAVSQESSAVYEDSASTQSPSASVEPRPSDWKLRPIGQALGMYIVADDGENLYIIDQHAAHERVLYEKFSKRMQETEVQSIQLLTPLTLTLSGQQFTAVHDNMELLADMGLVFEPFGGREVLLRSIPGIWEGLDYPRLVDDFLQALAEATGKSDVRDVLRERVVTKACKAAVKANEYLSSMEIDALCEALSTLEDPFHCPHGRPVFIRLSSHDLEKEFRRIV